MFLSQGFFSLTCVFDELKVLMRVSFNVGKRREGGAPGSCFTASLSALEGARARDCYGRPWDGDVGQL